jgi:hypothetical protein
VSYNGKVYIFLPNTYSSNPITKLKEIFVTAINITSNFVKTIFALQSRITSEMHVRTKKVMKKHDFFNNRKLENITNFTYLRFCMNFKKLCIAACLQAK